MKRDFRPLVLAGTLLGIGMGGFVDGIVFHQLLQLHNMLSAKYPVQGLDAEALVVNLEVNMFWDGLFHAVTWTVTAFGVVMLWRATGKPEVPHSTTALVGSLAIGWGLFNLVEGIIDHHILHIHHVVESANHAFFDFLFLGSSILLLVIGALLIRRAIVQQGSSSGMSGS